ncbi:MAG: hypothetical protein LT103_05510 [Burkholderiaceae bacterium]|nr:hypothetical protein [Burkholderiaceae bacterium]
MESLEGSTSRTARAIGWIFRHSILCDSSSAIRRAFSARSADSSSRSDIEAAPGEQIVHFVADAVPEVVAGVPYRMESGQQIELTIVGQRVDDLQRLGEHPHQGIEVALVLQADVVAESSRALAVEDHQFSDAFLLADATKRARRISEPL